jgi:ABC-type multidrug transport system fused ATPase/permease subunit
METKMEASPNLEDSSSWLSFIFMLFLDSIFTKGYQRPLELTDLGGIAKQDRADLLYDKFSKEYASECKKPKEKRSLWAVLWRTTSIWKLHLSLVLFCVYGALQFGPVQILTNLVKYFQGIEFYEKWELWLQVALLFVFPVVGSICLAHSNALMAHLGAQIRNTLIAAIYRKSLTISPYYKQAISTGRIITMFSDDTNQIRGFLFFMNNAICAPLQIGACLYLIYRQVGAATFVGLGYTIFTTPVTGVVFGIVFKIRLIKMKTTDARVKLMNEILQGIRIIKYYAWESAFVQKIMAIRTEELWLVAKMGYIFNGAFGLLLLGATQIQTVLIFITYISLGNQLDAATAFTTLTLFGLMTSPFIFLPFGIQQYNQSVISMRRIMEYLDTDDLEDYIQQVDMPSDETVVQFSKACMSWTPSVLKSISAFSQAPRSGTQKKPDSEAQESSGTPSLQENGLVVEPKEDFSNKAIHTLRDISVSVKQGQLVAIVGSVGCGKSSFLSAILGEMHIRSGEVYISKKNVDGESQAHSIAYTDQRPWIINATVKDNILFGKEYNEDHFNRAISAACLDDDLKILPGGILTEIGERGINLSGGQKARVALARAIYSDADIYLLDDPISAVDAHVGTHIIENCIQGALRNKTRFLVTHHLPLLPLCDQIVILDQDGTVKANGSLSEIINSGINVEQYLGHEQQDTSKTADEDTSVSNSEADRDPSSAKVKPSSKKLVDEEQGEEKKILMTKEDRKDGDVPLKTYWLFIKYGGLFPFFVVCFSQAATQVLGINANFWLADWGKETSIAGFQGTEMSMPRNMFWFHGYVGMQMASIFFLFLSRMALNYHRSIAATVLHERLLKNVLFLPVSFFDVTPVGRIINRFSQDISTIDEDLAQSISQVIGMGGGVLGALGAIAGSTKGTFLILAFPLGFIYSHFQSYYKKSNTAIARLEAVSRSPIYADFSQTLSGTTTVRAYSQQKNFILKLEGYANQNTVPGVLQQIASQWLAIRLDIVGALIMFFMGALTISLEGNSFIPAGYLALGLSYSIQLTGLLKMAVRVSSTMEAQFNSVERTIAYAEIPGAENESYTTSTDGKITAGSEYIPVIDEETQTSVKEVELQDRNMTTVVMPPSNWPQSGRVRFDNVQLRYRDGPLVLKGVSIDVGENEKIGVAGRTGCGYSFLYIY